MEARAFPPEASDFPAKFGEKSDRGRRWPKSLSAQSFRD